MSLKSEATQKRWSLLRNYILNPTKVTSKLDDCLYSANIFGLFEITQVIESPSSVTWRLVPQVAPGSCKYITLAIPKNSTELQNKVEDLVEFDRTGVAVPLWPCELLLAYFFMLPPGRIQNVLHLPSPCERVIELAAGGLGIGGIALASVFPNLKYLAVTDGNDKCVQNLKNVIKEGNYTFHSKLESALLRWSSDIEEGMCFAGNPYLKGWFGGQPGPPITTILTAPETRKKVQRIDTPLYSPKYPSGNRPGLSQLELPSIPNDRDDWKSSFDLVFAADCFFNPSHGGLLRCIDFLLSRNSGSTFLALAPLRSNTLKSFVELASSEEVCERFQWSVTFLRPEAVFPEISGDEEKMVPHVVYIQRR
ncbi:hypothetical protein ACTXT7_010219 [Hymenolepis weldensis]